jgi:hypothetical protein
MQYVVPTRTRVMAIAVVAVVVSALLSAVAGPRAVAATTLSQVPGTSYQANGRVQAILVVGNVIYLGGKFTSLRPAGAAPGSGEVARNRLAAIDRNTGAVLPWNPNADNDVYALALSPDGATVYAGGLFAKVGGLNRKRVAGISAASGSVGSWAPPVSGKVYAIATLGSRVYLGGTFTKVDGQPRTKLAAVSASGTLDPSWKPVPDDKVRSLAVALNGSSVYAGGDFFSVSGSDRSRHLANLDPVTGAVKPWTWKPGYSVWSMVVTADRIYLGGDGAGGHVAAHGLPNGNRIWQRQTDGGVQGITLVGGTLVAGGHFDNLCQGNTTVGSGSGGGFPCDANEATRHKLLAVDATTGLAQSWNPGANSNLGVFALATAGSTVFAGGDFTTIGGKNQQRFASFG